MISLIYPIIPVSKPTGNLSGKRGHIVQNLGDYGQFKKDVKVYSDKVIKATLSTKFPVYNTGGIRVTALIKKPKTRYPDLGQIVGGIYDSLVPDILRDDNLKGFKNSYTVIEVDSEFQGFMVDFAANQAEFDDMLVPKKELLNTLRMELRSQMFNHLPQI